jgi:hypothetical protein
MRAMLNDDCSESDVDYVLNESSEKLADLDLERIVTDNLNDIESMGKGFLQLDGQQRVNWRLDVGIANRNSKNSNNENNCMNENTV